MPIQVENGKAFEYSLAQNYFIYLRDAKVRVELVNSKNLKYAKKCYDSLTKTEKEAFDTASIKTIETLVLIVYNN